HADKSTMTLAPGATDSVFVTFAINGLPTAQDTVAVSATYSDLANRTITDTGLEVGLVPSVAQLFQPQVTGPVGTVYLTAASVSGVGFSVRNLGIAAATYRMRVDLTGAGYSFPSWLLPDTILTVPAGGTALYVP